MTERELEGLSGGTGELGETRLLRPVGEEVVRMHGHAWLVRARAYVRIEAITDPAGAGLGASNWRGAYAGACGQASFAEDAAGGLWVVQVRGLAYPCAAGEGEHSGDVGAPSGLRRTQDILRTSSGALERDARARTYTLVTRRTRYVFREVEQ